MKSLINESVYIIREIARQFKNPYILFSGGKDSITVLHLAIRAFYPAKIPFKLLHIDTGHNFKETIDFRDKLVEEYGLDLEVRYVEDAIKRHNLQEESGPYASRNGLQTYALLDAIRELKIDACLGGARRDEEKARAKERIFSVRNAFGQWDAKQQRPELFDILNGQLQFGQTIRTFPISNWTELDVWNYLREEEIELPSLYFAHQREVFERDGLIWTSDPSVFKESHEKVSTEWVRFRTIGDMSCTAAVYSKATSIDTVIQEIASSTLSERGARIDDKRSEAAMEERKAAGYF